MDLTEHCYSVLLVSSSAKFNSSLLGLLPENRYYPITVATDEGSARRNLLENQFDIAIINTPLTDEFGTRLALDICNSTGTGVLLLVKAEHFPDINGRVSPYGVLVISKPTSSLIITQSLQLLCGTRERLRRMEQKTASIEEKMEEIQQYELIHYLDVCVDGEFQVDKKEVRLKWKGSSNQRVIDVQASLRENRVVLYTE